MAKTADIQVLIVDDEKEIREAVSGLFRAFGFSVDTAHSGSRAWDLCISKSFHIVITDIRMADGGGIELLQKIRAKSLTSPKVFLITGFTDHTFEKLFSMGADGIFNKPFDSKLLMRTVRQALLANTDKWSRESEEEPEDEIELSFPSLEEAEKSGKFIIGRGGFSVVLEKASPSLVEKKAVWFEVTFAKGDVSLISGTGIIRWVRLLDQKGRTALGIEFTFLSEECRDQICDYIELLKLEGAKSRTLATIPSGPQT